MKKIICVVLSAIISAVSFGQDVLRSEPGMQDEYGRILREQLLPSSERMEWGFLLVPSFEAESSLYFSGRNGSPMLIRCYPDSSIWYDVRHQMVSYKVMDEEEQKEKFGQLNGFKINVAVPTGVTWETATVHSSIHRDTLSITSEQATVLSAMFETAVGTAVNMLDEGVSILSFVDESGKTRYFESVGLDGETYHVFYRHRGAYCWSPDRETKCGRLVAILNELMRNVREGQGPDPELLDRAEKLTAELTVLYPVWYQDYLENSRAD